MHDIYKQKCLVKSIYLVLQIKHCKKVHSSIGFKGLWLKNQMLPYVYDTYDVYFT